MIFICLYCELSRKKQPRARTHIMRLLFTADLVRIQIVSGLRFYLNTLAEMGVQIRREYAYCDIKPHFYARKSVNDYIFMRIKVLRH